MDKFLKLYFQLMAKGFATAEEKAELKELAEDAESETAEEKVEEVNSLPEAEEPTEDEVADEVAKSISERIEKSIEKALANHSAEAIEKAVESTAKAVAKQNRDMRNKAGLHHEDVKSQRKEANKWLAGAIKEIGAGRQAKDFLNGGTGADGGFTIDETLFAEINLLTTEFGVARREMQVLTVSGRKAKLNALAADVAVNWTSEGGQKALTKFTLEQIAPELQKMTAIVPWSDELAEDTEIDVIGFLAQRFAEKIAQKEDDAFFNGDGSSTYSGITGVLNSATNSVVLSGTTFESMDTDDLSDMIDELPQGAHANAKFYLHRTNMSTIRKLKDNEGRYIYQAPSQGGPATIWGFSVVQVEAMPSRKDSAEDTPFVVFGDLRRAYTIIEKPAGTQFMVSNEGTLAFTNESQEEELLSLYQQDLTALRVVKRVGGATILPDAIVVLKTAPVSA